MMHWTQLYKIWLVLRPHSPLPNAVAKHPLCEDNRRIALQVSIDFNNVWTRLCRPFLMPRDFKNYRLHTGQC